jgi:hypothetical protein
LAMPAVHPVAPLESPVLNTPALMPVAWI